MQVFRTVFTADIKQYRGEMKKIKQTTNTTFGSVRNIVAMAGIAMGGLTLGRIIADTVKLGAEMEQTEVAFNTFLGSAKKGEAAIRKLMNFSTVTPFKPAEVIAAGRALLAANVQVRNITGELQILGNIASGVSIPLQDIVNIYAKSKNKGKVQAEELNQMSERGIPILDALAKSLKKSKQEVLEMGSKGQLSFSILQDALRSLGGEGGKYFGLMEKQSKTLAGRWSTLIGLIELMQTNMSRMANSELSKVLGEINDELTRMQKSGELDAMITDVANALAQTVRVVRDLVKWLIDNREIIATMGLAAASIVVWHKLNVMMTATAALLKTMQGINIASTLRQSSTGIKLLTTDMRTMARATGGIRTALSSVAAAGAVAFVGWKVGKKIAEMSELEDKIFAVLQLQNSRNRSSGTDAFDRNTLVRNWNGNKDLRERYNGEFKEYEAHMRRLHRKAIKGRQDSKTNKKTADAKAKADADNTSAGDSVGTIEDDNSRSLKDLKKRIADLKKNISTDIAEDALAKRIERWNNLVKRFKSEIKEASAKLKALGIDTNRNTVLKSKDEISQDRKNKMLQVKIEAYNKGEQVTFSQEEKQRIANANRQLAGIHDKKNNIDAVNTQSGTAKKEFDQQRNAAAKAARNQQLAGLQQKYGVAKDVASTIDAARKGNEPMVKVLAEVKEILNKRLPGEA
ncbi:MAG: tape measure protein [Victivallaceae bacterium]|nr:tape measure protein [Victivallaceae bacterium]